MYTIYHIPGKKVGCTANLRGRKKQYPKGTEFEILEELDCSVGPLFAGDREHYWADYFGYKRGHHYAHVGEAGKKGFKTQRELGKNPFQIMEPEKRSEIGKVGFKTQWEMGKNPFQTFSIEKRREGANHPNNGFKTGAAQKASISSPNHSTKQLLKYVEHGIVGNSPNMKRWHKECTLETVL